MPNRDAEILLAAPDARNRGRGRTVGAASATATATGPAASATSGNAPAAPGAALLLPPQRDTQALTTRAVSAGPQGSFTAPSCRTGRPACLVTRRPVTGLPHTRPLGQEMRTGT
jgi:hypothetical protein